MAEPTTNPAINVADKINDIIFETVVASVESYSRAQLPFLNLPVISQLFDLIVRKLAGLIKDQLENFVAFTIIDIQVSSEDEKYKKAIMDLQLAYHSGDLNVTALAEDNFRKTLGNLIHWDGA